MFRNLSLILLLSATGALQKSNAEASLSGTSFLRKGRALQSLTNQTQDFVSGPQINQDREVDIEYCFGAYTRHDSDGNQRLSQSEYLDFVQDLGSNTECLGNLQTLPLEIMACWNQLSCECRQRGGARDCCEGNNAHIPITGVAAKQDGTGSEPFVVEEQDFLAQGCIRTDQCVIAFCGVPPPPVIPPPPPAAPLAPIVQGTGAAPTKTYWELFALLALLLCCCRRRWCFFAGAKHDDEEDESSSESEAEPEGGVMENGVTEDGVPPVAPAGPAALAADYADPDANRQTLRATEEDEEGMGGGVMYSRSVQEPEWEEDPVRPGPKAIEQFDPPPPPEDDFQLKHIEKAPPPPPEDDPYALERYVPDGGIVEHERTGNWEHNADGGWTPEERTGKDPSEWNRDGYDRQEHVDPEAVDNRRNRHLDAMGGGAIFDHLDDDEQVDANAGPSGNGDMFSWVISSTLSTLDQKQDDLRSSGHSRKSEESK